MKKILASCIIAALATTTFAKPTQMITAGKYSDQRFQQWCLDHSLSRANTCPTAMGFNYSDQPITAIFYVNRYVSNTVRPSDPVRVECNYVPVIINPGNSFVCTLPAGTTAHWEVEDEYKHNGADGMIFYPEPWQW